MESAQLCAREAELCAVFSEAVHRAYSPRQPLENLGIRAEIG